jgi:hypothetical protein
MATHLGRVLWRLGLILGIGLFVFAWWASTTAQRLGSAGCSAECTGRSDRQVMTAELMVVRFRGKSEGTKAHIDLPRRAISSR